MLKEGMPVVLRKGLHFPIDKDGGLRTFKPWLGDAFSLFYDFFMEYSIFPKKLGAEMDRHAHILRNELKGVHEKRVLELAAGSGSAVRFLAKDNQYTGTDISPGLLRKAVKRFRKAGFTEAEFFVARADDLPFQDSSFDFILCILSLNFFDDIPGVFQEVRRVAVPGASLLVSVNVPERCHGMSKIRGTLFSEEELRRQCEEHGMTYEAVPSQNGALLYFKAFVP